MDRKIKGLLVLLPVALFLVTFFYFPLFFVLGFAFTAPFSSWKEQLIDPLFLRFLGFTFLQAIITALGSSLIGLPSGYLLARKKLFFPSALRAAITVPFIFPPLAILLGMVKLFSVNGFANSTFGFTFNPFSFGGILFIHILYNVSVMSRISESAFSTEPAEYHLIASTLGASRWLRLQTITIPHIRPAIEAGFLLVFLYAFNSFAIVLILGEVKLQTLEVMIYTQSRFRLNYTSSAILVCLQLVINLLMIYLYSRRTYRQNTESMEIITQSTTHQARNTLLLSFIILVTWLPIIVLLFTTFQGMIANPALLQDTFSGKYDRLLGTSSLRVIINTLFFGLITAIMAIVFSTTIVLAMQIFPNDHRIEQLSVLITLIPMATSAISLSLGLLLTHGKYSYFSNNVWLFIIIAQILAALPFASRSLISGWKGVPTDLILVSKTLSASWAMTFEKVILPFIRSALLVSMLFSFAISIGEFGATYYLARGEWVTLSISIYRMFSTRNVLLPNIYASMLILVTLVLFISIEKIGRMELRL
ncbi:MAG: iron ABC transporter permease [Candidatus Heimdallarchaeota archaeon]|nr:iron ABC transporter permease [Candidatus Heimdallarchaeota archaeon]